MKLSYLFIVCVQLLIVAPIAWLKSDEKSSINKRGAVSTNNFDLLKRMFQEVTVEKNSDAIPKYYHQDFEMHANGVIQRYAAFLESHRKVFSSDLQYKVRYDEDLRCQSSEVGGLCLRCQSSEVEVWELFSPDKSTLPVRLQRLTIDLDTISQQTDLRLQRRVAA